MVGKTVSLFTEAPRGAKQPYVVEVGIVKGKSSTHSQSSVSNCA